jgi:protein dithiol oxidoreductase (disulfide-forming)
MYRYILLLCLCVLGGMAYADQQPVFQAGKHYEVLSQAAVAPVSASSKIQVIEFFSYACPWCARLEPILQAWAKKNAARVELVRVPVEFREPWTLYAKAYYIAHALDADHEITPALFSTIQAAHETPLGEQQLAEVFAAHHVRAEEFINALHFSPSIDAQLAEGRQRVRQFGIVAAPTLIVAQRYKTDPQLAGDITKIPALLDYLLLQAKAA